MLSTRTRSPHYPEYFTEALRMLIDDWDGGTKYIHNYQGDHVRGLNTLHGLVAAGLVAHADPRGRTWP